MRRLTTVAALGVAAAAVAWWRATPTIADGEEETADDSVSRADFVWWGALSRLALAPILLVGFGACVCRRRRARGPIALLRHASSYLITGGGRAPWVPIINELHDTEVSYIRSLSSLSTARRALPEVPLASIEVLHGVSSELVRLLGADNTGAHVVAGSQSSP